LKPKYKSSKSSPPVQEEYPQGEVVGDNHNSPGIKKIKQTESINNLPYLKTFRKKLRNNSTPAEAKLRDTERTLFLNDYGINVIRFENKLVFENTEWVLGEIKRGFNRPEMLPKSE